MDNIVCFVVVVFLDGTFDGVQFHGGDQEEIDQHVALVKSRPQNQGKQELYSEISTAVLT